MDGPDWLSRRRREQPLFHREAVTAWTGVIVDSTERLLDDWAVSARSGSPRDVAADMMRVALEVVSGVLFPASFAYDRARVLDATMQVLSHIMTRSRTLGLVPSWLPTSGNRRFRRALADLDAVLYAMIRERRTMPPGGSDLLSHLMSDTDGSPTPLPDHQLRDELLTMIIAGHETVASALAWSWHLLAENPDQDEYLGASPALPTGMECAQAATDSFAARVFEETLRLFPPAWVITRKAIEPVDAGGFTIPAGGLVAISPWVIHRDPALWPDPARFDPSRHADRIGRNTFIPFGAGPHLCIGVHLARLEAAIVLSLAAKRFRLQPVPGRVPVVEPGVTLHPRGGLWMRIEPRPGT